MGDLAKAIRSLEGLSVGDAFGELFFAISPRETSLIDLPTRPWRWTDDTHMALSVVDVLKTYGRIDQDALAGAFAWRYRAEPHRGYGAGAHQLLQQIFTGQEWRTISPTLFGSGSYGNGAAMRVAPLGGFFCDDLQRAAQEAARSAAVTHAHPEGIAGAMAVAVAAATAAKAQHPTGRAFLSEVLMWIPDGLTKERTRLAHDIPADDLAQAVSTLGTGHDVSARDTVPFCLWNAAHHLDDYEGALWQTVRGLGDRDTTCAIVGGIVALSALEIPPAWIQRRETLPSL
jgi:ADP-ribosylglycohydrolase